jgi:hypothetical protein
MTVCKTPDGTTTSLSAKDMDSSEMVVREIFRVFDLGKAVAYPGRLSVRAATWLPRLLPRFMIVQIAAKATEKMGLHDSLSHSETTRMK